jgi:hypothetical protein
MSVGQYGANVDIVSLSREIEFETNTIQRKVQKNVRIFGCGHLLFSRDEKKKVVSLLGLEGMPWRLLIQGEF